jgi:hypothetical protein
MTAWLVPPLVAPIGIIVMVAEYVKFRALS